PVHAVWRHAQGSPSQLHRCRGTGRRRTPLQSFRGPAARPDRRAGRDRPVRCDDGRRAGQRRPRNPPARAMNPPLVLASQSPRRAELLRTLNLTFDVAPADIDEAYRPGGTPSAHAERLAREKALTVARRRPDALVAGSDTVVVVDGVVLGKPADGADAVAMLMRLQ